MNYMKQIAQMLGVELEEEFYLEDIEDGYYVLNDNTGFTVTKTIEMLINYIND